MTHVTHMPAWIRALPRRHVSRLFGQVAELHVPKALLVPALRAYARAFGVDLDEAVRPVGDYASFLDFFTRRLKKGARTWPDDPSAVAAPADGKVHATGTVEEGRIFQVKGVPDRVSDLLGDPDLAARFEGGSALTTYLAPGDYHRFHWPFDARVTRVEHLPGDLWPVHPGAVRDVPRLFARNERVVVSGTVPQGGDFAWVAVGALNVGSIRLTFHPVRTNRLAGAAGRRDDDLHVDAHRGDEMGWFRMGSSIVLLITKETGRLDDLPEGHALRVGQRVGTLARMGR